MMVTDAAAATTRHVVSDLTVGRPTSVTDPLSHATTYSYDSCGRLTRITAPEGNYVAYTYDGARQCHPVRHARKARQQRRRHRHRADYPATCSNVFTCNLPTATRDALGTSDRLHLRLHPWRPAHRHRAGAVAGAVRPQTRYTYSSLTAPGGGSVYRLTGVSPCRTQFELRERRPTRRRTTIAYSQANLLPSSVSIGLGRRRADRDRRPSAMTRSAG